MTPAELPAEAPRERSVPGGEVLDRSTDGAPASGSQVGEPAWRNLAQTSAVHLRTNKKLSNKGCACPLLPVR